jgi:GDP-4-dehydro-6-deoxy-D-mannose reductase
MAILVTGAKGFVGQYLTDPDIVAFEGDIRDDTAVRRALEEHRPDAVIHLAAIASPREASRQADVAWAVNVMGTFTLAQAMLDLVPDARLVFAGSSEVYGQSFADAGGAPVSETAPLKPLSRYGATKAAAEVMLMQMAREGLRVTCFRPFNHTGPGQASSYVMSSFAQQIARIEQGLQEPVLRTGNLDLVRDFLDVQDVARAYLLVARGDASAEGECVNLASGRPMALRQLLDHMLSRSTVAIRQETDPNSLRATDVPIVSGDIGKASALLGWSPQIPIEETLERMLDDWRSLVLK